MTQAEPRTQPDRDSPFGVLGGLFDRTGVRVGHARGAEIYAQDEEVEYLHRVVKGVVRTTRLTADGRRQVGAFYYPGDIFGLEPGPAHRFAAEALSSAEVQSIRVSAARATIGDPTVDQAILAATRLEMERLQDHVLVLGLKGACERVASFLMSMAEGSPDRHIDLPMGRQDMADYLGLTIETVSRALGRLQDEAIVEFPSTRRFQVRRWRALEALAA